MARLLILLTSDDGVESPGLAAAAAALDSLGDLLIVAPSAQQSAMGRSMPITSDGRLIKTRIGANGLTWEAYGANASPAQAIQHALLELAPRRPDLAVSGINYGENLGISITISGTVGAAMEAATHGIPALAISLQVEPAFHMSNDRSVDFSVAMHFTRQFAMTWLALGRIPDVDLLKIDIPATATVATEWRVARLERQPYYRPLRPLRDHLHDAGAIGYEIVHPPDRDTRSDVSMLLDGMVAVVPLSLDMTSRFPLDDLQKRLGDVAG